MSKVKICGIRREDDVKYVNRYLPEYVGFIFAESRRRVSAEQAKVLGAGLDPRIKKVGVFVNELLEKVADIAVECGLDAVQIHGDETPAYISELRKEIKARGGRTQLWKAIRVNGGDALKGMDGYDADAFVLDTYTEGCYGGSGSSFDWNLAAEAGKRHRIILAGGLTPGNVFQAVRIVQPCVVDVSSGVETDGWKDEGKIRDFICTVRNYD